MYYLTIIKISQEKSRHTEQKDVDNVGKKNYNNGIQNRKRGENMGERDKKILKTIAEALPKMSEFDKGYFLGTAEAKAADKKRNKKDSESSIGTG